MSIQFTTVSTLLELQQILDLQAQNHASVLSASAMADQGFVTVRHRPDVLARMNASNPSVIAKDGDQLVGYALMMPRSFAADVPELAPMFEMLDGLAWRGQSLRDAQRWFVMGQICVAEIYRGKDVFEGMYMKMRETCAKDYDFVITEVAERNTRSMRAHERIGFQTLQTHTDQVSGAVWRTIVWDWLQP